MKKNLSAMALLLFHVLGVGFPVAAAVKLSMNKGAVLEMQNAHRVSEKSANEVSDFIEEQIAPTKASLNPFVIFRDIVHGTPEESFNDYLSKNLSSQEYQKTLAIVQSLRGKKQITREEGQAVFQQFMREVVLKKLDPTNQKRVLGNLDLILVMEKENQEIRFPAFQVPEQNMEVQAFYDAMLKISLIALGGLAITDFILFPTFRQTAWILGDMLASITSWFV